MEDKKKSAKPKTKTHRAIATKKTETKKKVEIVIDKPAEEKTQAKAKKKPFNKTLFWGIVGGLVALAIIFVAILVSQKTPDPTDPKSSPTYTNAFFIYNDGKYTLWNSEGKRLTDEEYNDKSSFIGGYAYVRKGSEYALISDTGKVMLDYGQISSINDYGAGLYIINDNNGGQHLMLGNGKIVLSGDKLDLEYSSNTATFGAVKLNGVYNVFNYAGILMAQIEEADGETMRLSANNDFGLIYYNGWNYIFDNRAGKQITSFEAKRFSFDTISDDRTTILLDDYEDSKEYKVVRNGQLFDLTETKNYGLVRGTNWIVGYDDYSAISLLDNEFKVIKKLSSDVAIKDGLNYAVKNENNGVEVYYRGELVRTFDKNADLASGVLSYADLYAIRSEGKYGFYHLDGSFAFGEYGDIYSLFDKHHHASVSENGEDYYMIDANGNKVNDLTYRRIYTYDDSYVLYNKESKRAILTAAGEPITDFEYSEAYNRSVAVDHEIWSLKRSSNNYDIIDAKAPAEKRLILSGVNPYDFYANYFTVKNSDGGYDYYTYKGVQFFRTTKK